MAAPMASIQAHSRPTLKLFCKSDSRSKNGTFCLEMLKSKIKGCKEREKSGLMAKRIPTSLATSDMARTATGLQKDHLRACYFLGTWGVDGSEQMGSHFWTGSEFGGFPGGTSGKRKKKNPLANVGDLRNTGSISVMGKSPGGGNGNQLQYSSLENAMAEEPGGLQSTASQRVGHN